MRNNKKILTNLSSEEDTNLQIYSKKKMPDNFIFGEKYLKLGDISRKFFKKECLKKKKKIITYSEEGITIEIRSKVRGKFL